MNKILLNSYLFEYLFVIKLLFIVRHANRIRVFIYTHKYQWITQEDRISMSERPFAIDDYIEICMRSRRMCYISLYPCMKSCEIDNHSHTVGFRKCNHSKTSDQTPLNHRILGKRLPSIASAPGIKQIDI